MPVVLDHAEDGDVQAVPGQGLKGHRRMGLSPVDEQQVRAAGKGLVPLLLMAEAAGDDLVHGGIVVRPVQVLSLIHI